MQGTKEDGRRGRQRRRGEMRKTENKGSIRMIERDGNEILYKLYSIEERKG